MISRRALRMSNELGEQIDVHYDDKDKVNAAVQACIEEAEKSLPPQTVYEIRGKVRPDDPIHRDRAQPGRRKTRAQLAKNWGVAWYWTSADQNGYYGGMRQEPIFRHPVELAEPAPYGGYIVIARLRTP